MWIFTHFCPSSGSARQRTVKRSGSPFSRRANSLALARASRNPAQFSDGKVDDRIPQRHRRMVGDKRFFRLPIHPLSKPVEMIRVREHVEHGDRHEWLARGATFLKR
jgi:hypothetical protein